MKITSETLTELHPLVTPRHCSLGDHDRSRGAEKHEKTTNSDKDEGSFPLSFI